MFQIQDISKAQAGLKAEQQFGNSEKCKVAEAIIWGLHRSRGKMRLEKLAGATFGEVGWLKDLPSSLFIPSWNPGPGGERHSDSKLACVGRL
jgi:hypothetical protein